MATIAALRILLGLDPSGVKSGSAIARGELRAVQGEANRTQMAMAELRRGFATGLGLGGGAVGFIAATRAVGALTDALGDAVRGAIAEEAGIKRLDTALRANVPAWDGNTTAIEKTIAARQALGFADDEQRDALARTVAATNDVSRAFEIQATAMDLARFKGISLADATDALIRIEGGQFRALKALGIELAAGATQTEALAAVQKVAAGQAEEFGKTTEGAMAAASVELSNLSEDFGTLLLPLVKDLATALRNDVIPAVRDTAAIIGELSAAIDGLPDQLPFIGLALDAQSAAAGLREELQGVQKEWTLQEEWAAAAGNAIDGATTNVSNLARTTPLAEDAMYALGSSMGTAELRAWALAGALREADRQAEAVADIDWEAVTPPSADDRGMGVPNPRQYPRNTFAQDAAAEQRDVRRAAAQSDRARQQAEEQARLDREREQAQEALYEAATKAAREHFDEIHRLNLDAIDDIRDRRDAELSAQADAIQGAVDAERQRIEAIRDRERENELRAAVGAAETPEDRAAAQRELNRFLEDQRLERLQANATAEKAKIDEQRRQNAATADLAKAAENERAKREREAFDAGVANGVIVSPVVTDTASGIMPAWSLTVPVTVYVDGDKVVDAVERRQAGLNAIYNPQPVSTGSQR